MKFTWKKVLLFAAAIISLSGIILGFFFLPGADKLGFQLIFSMNTGLLAILLASFLIYRILSQKIISNKMAEIASDIRIGANAYLTRQIRTILIFSPILLLLVFGLIGWQTGWQNGLLTALTTVIGIFTSLTVYQSGFESTPFIVSQIVA